MCEKLKRQKEFNMRIIKTSGYKKISGLWGPLGSEKALGKIRYLNWLRDEEYGEDTGRFVVQPHAESDDSLDVFYITTTPDTIGKGAPPVQKIFVDTVGSIEEAKMKYPSVEIDEHTREESDLMGNFEETFNIDDATSFFSH